MYSGEIPSREEGEGRIAHTTACKDHIKFGTPAKPTSDTAAAKLRARPWITGAFVTGSESVLDPFLALHPPLYLRAGAVLRYRGAGSFNAALHHCRTALSQLIRS
jgi:hypothetical protein